MKNAIDFANEIAEAVQVTGVITIEGDLEEFMKQMDDPKLFVRELKAKDIVITRRTATHLAMLPSVNIWVIIKAEDLIKGLNEKAIELLVEYSKQRNIVLTVPELKKLTKDLVNVLYLHYQNDMPPITPDFMDLLRSNTTISPTELYKTFAANNPNNLS